MSARRIISLAALLLCVAAPSLPAAPAADAQVDDDAIDRALTRGRTWLAAQQQPDGGWRSEYDEKHAEGTTALAVLTLLKSGTPPDDPSIERGMARLRSVLPKSTYVVALTMLAIEARYQPKPSDEDPRRVRTMARARFQRAGFKPDVDLMKRCLHWLLQARNGSVWRYPQGGQDLSCTQYALMGLKAAVDLGLEVNPNVFLQSTRWLLEKQAEDGPAVEPFEIPAGDGPLNGRPRRPSPSGRHPRGTVERPKGEGSRERDMLRARGWGYQQPEDSSGSMTTAGIAGLVIGKSVLEEAGQYVGPLGAQVDEAIRDGAAWIAHHFAVDANPKGSASWHFYYLYGLERAGALLAVHDFGLHDWYAEGSRYLLGRQKPEGCWKAGPGEVIDSCFALLFLRRATVPLKKLPPKRVPTSGGGPG